jgi:hypothetical protein
VVRIFCIANEPADDGTQARGRKRSDVIKFLLGAAAMAEIDRGVAAVDTAL